jgi:hypothetical protein
MLQKYFGTLPQIFALAQFFRPRGLVYALTMHCKPYIDRCVPFQIMSNQLNLPKVDSNQIVEKYQV